MDGKGNTINGYYIIEDFQEVGGGNCQYSFATKNGKNYFIKRFLKPLFPTPESPGSESTKKRKMIASQAFEDRHRKIMDLLLCKTLEGGNLVVTRDFFRHKSHYYKITDKVDTTTVDPKQVSNLNYKQKLILLGTLAHSLKTLHNVGIVHGDLKPDNVLIQKNVSSQSKNDVIYVAKLIDFDDSFFNGSPPDDSSEIIGDPTYYSPELGGYITNNKEIHPSEVTVKSDIFALGLLFHQYLTGNLPDFDRAKFNYAYVAANQSSGFQLSTKLPYWVRNQIQLMLNKEINKRPSIDFLYQIIRNNANPEQETSIHENIQSTNNLKGNLITRAKNDNPSKLKGKGLTKI